MASKPEGTFTRGVGKYLPARIYAMKNHNPYVGGIPDMWYSGDRADLWVEYKFLPRTPLRASVRPFTLLSELQLRWLNERYAEGRTVGVVVGCPDGGVILRDQEWLQEFTPEMFRNRLLPRKSIAQWITDTTTR